MTLNIQEDVARLNEMTVGQLQREFLRLTGEGTKANNKVYLVKRIAWRKQVLAEGDISERARLRAAELANEADLRVRAPRGTFDPPQPAKSEHTCRVPFTLRDNRLPALGGILRRNYKGTDIEVRVIKQGFRCNGKTYKSLSAIAREVTGTNWNGFDFFGLKR